MQSCMPSDTKEMGCILGQIYLGAQGAINEPQLRFENSNLEYFAPPNFDVPHPNPS